MPWADEGVFNPPGTELLGHSGGSPGCSSFIGFDLKKRRGVVVLSNQRTLRSAAVGWRILQGMPLATDNMLVRQHGIGTSLDTDAKSGMAVINKVFQDSPAGKAGLRAGMLIQQINGVAVEGKTPRQCIRLMAGPAGTKVRLAVLDVAKNEQRSVELTKRKFLTAAY